MCQRGESASVMNKSTVLKFIQFGLILILGIAADQGTKWYAEARLATARPGHFNHEIVLSVPADLAGKSARDVLAREFTWSTPEELDRIGQSYLRSEDDKRLNGADTVVAGQKLHVTYRDVTIIEDYWDFQYTRNPGAAFGFLASSDSALRRPFFVGVSALAILIIIYILAGVTFQQQLLIWGLSLIASGAVGNFIDRVRFGYVIDFILWKYTNEHRWPTFNVADALICVGVGFMILEMIRDGIQQRKEAQALAALPAADTSAAPDA